ncbi:glucosamine kinase [Mycolicibacterium pallens]|uniref:Glucosamine kinase n=1 Tax=Mycolicibacterium pallens TaxID=370524 RepID=A0ABX8VP62_9MYCO|nr:glucosamine kinase [Mycolicibacterium pallens]APE17211.1 aminoglycoside phosphotransferase [Mycobacterium sp. WY10]QYL17301.1 aminoglycoside phosphotransferase [Mycolicibacterium pallens]
MDGERDSLNLAEGKRLSIISTPDGLAAVPQIRRSDGSWRRARAGDGVAEALLAMLAVAPASTRSGAFTVRAWSARSARGERPITVDQTNESVIVGDEAVVKWATHLQAGPHPAPHRIEVLRANGFRSMPAPWGIVTWQPDGCASTLVVSVDEYLPDAVDGWTWAVELIAAGARGRDPQCDAVVSAVAEVGTVVAELHAALAGTVSTASRVDAERWCSSALDTLREAASVDDAAVKQTLTQRRTTIEDTLSTLGGLPGTPVIEGHGDLHVGQILQYAGGYRVTDFDGNPVLPAAERALPIPAALDVAGFMQSLTHAAIVAQRHHRVDPQALVEVERCARETFLLNYTRDLAELGCAELFDPAPLAAFRLQQVLREVVYASRHLRRWMYVPDAALPMLLDERISG